MSREERIACFQDTLERCGADPLQELTRLAREQSRVYPENYRSARLFKVREPEISVVEGTSFAVARENRKHGKTAVLNFANPHYPGGGVFQGAKAQEESLCRSSNLYPCLEDGRVFEDFYRYQQKQTDYDFSDRLIYTPGVTVFKDDAAVPALLPEDQWFAVDVITCAAPYLAKRRYVNPTVLRERFASRIRNILEAAIDNEIEVLILGAFGCGAFKNPPEVVARAFRQVLAASFHVQLVAGGHHHPPVGRADVKALLDLRVCITVKGEQNVGIVFGIGEFFAEVAFGKEDGVS